MSKIYALQLQNALAEMRRVYAAGYENGIDWNRISQLENEITAIRARLQKAREDEMAS